MHWPALNKAAIARLPSIPEEVVAYSAALRRKGPRTDRLTPDLLLERHLADVHRYIGARVSKADVDDVTAEVFGAAVEALPRFQGKCPPRAWLLGIARRKVADTLRRRARKPEASLSSLPAELLASPDDSPESTMRREEAALTIRRIMEGLPALQREALLLQYIDDLPIAEIATVMGRSLGAVNSLLQRARGSVYRLGEAYFLDEGEVRK